MQQATVDSAPTVGFDFDFNLRDDLGDVGRLIADVIGNHGVTLNGGIKDFFGGGPFANFGIFREGGFTVSETTDALFKSMNTDIIPRINFDTGLLYGHFGLGASATPANLIPSLNVDAKLDERASDLWDGIGNATGWWRQGGAVSNSYSTDPELAMLLSELIQTVKDKEMGVNIFNETGQNMRVSDGEGAGFNESSYRESSNLA